MGQRKQDEGRNQTRDTYDEKRTSDYKEMKRKFKPFMLNMVIRTEKPIQYLIKIWIKGNSYFGGSWFTFNRLADKDIAIKLAKQLVRQGQRVRIYYKNNVIWSYLTK